MTRRLLFVVSQPFYQWRGSPIRVAFNVKALAEMGYSVDLLTLPIGDDKEIPGVRLIRAPNILGARRVAIGPSITKAAFDLVLALMAAVLSRRHKYDVIHCVEDAGMVGTLVSALTGCKFVFEKHSDPLSYSSGFWGRALMPVYAKVERAMMRKADAVICTGPGLAEQARNVKGSNSVYEISDIPSSLVAADVSATDRIRSKLLNNGAEKLIMYVGSFAVYQGVELIFRSVPMVAERNPGARYVIIGGTDEEIEQEKSWLSSQGVADAVKFIGRVPPDELPNYLSASDILLSPRLAGVNTPLKLLDYMKAGRAIVATDTTANRQILDDSVAKVVEPDPESFAEGICELLERPGHAARLGAGAKSLIESRYGFKLFKSKLDECYKTVFEDSTKGS